MAQEIKPGYFVTLDKHFRIFLFEPINCLACAVITDFWYVR